MCNRYRMTAKEADLVARYGADPVFPPDESWPPPELFPKRAAWVVRREDGRTRLDVMRWGFPPPAGGRAPVTNVRNLASPFWRTALASPDRRCLVPVSDFCEWEGERGAKVARWFSVPSRPVFSFAGIWRPVEESKAFAFLTCAPNALVAPIHPKAMPVILHEEDHDLWLTGSYEQVCALAAPFPTQLMSLA